MMDVVRLLRLVARRALFGSLSVEVPGDVRTPILPCPFLGKHVCAHLHGLALICFGHAVVRLVAFTNVVVSHHIEPGLVRVREHLVRHFYVQRS